MLRVCSLEVDKLVKYFLCLLGVLGLCLRDTLSSLRPDIIQGVLLLPFAEAERPPLVGAVAIGTI